MITAAAEMSKVPAHWEEIGKAVALRNSMKSETVIIGNGDVKSRQDGMEKYEQYKMDGVMIGRGVFDNVWIFNKDIDPQSISHQQKIQTLIEHIELFDKVWGKQKNPEIMKKFYKVYVSGMPDAAEFRAALMQCKGAEETVTLLKEKINKKIISV
jgi:tRNA-dihydrouridine synthase